MNDIDVIVFTSDKHLWAVQPFAWLFNKYWYDQRAIIVGYNRPSFLLPSNMIFYSIGPNEYPAEKWAEGAIAFFEDYQSDQFIFFHEDYWLTRMINKQDIYDLSLMMDYYSDVVRIDLTGDRLYAGGMRDVGYWSHFDLVQAPDSQYEMSHQACIFKTEKYVEVLKSLPEGKRSAWNVELEGTTYINSHKDKMKVFGTRQWPVRYANALLKGKIDWKELEKLTNEDYNAVGGLIPERYRENQ